MGAMADPHSCSQLRPIRARRDVLHPARLRCPPQHRRPLAGRRLLRRRRPARDRPADRPRRAHRAAVRRRSRRPRLPRRLGAAARPERQDPRRGGPARRRLGHRAAHRHRRSRSISNISDRWWLWTILVPVGLLVWWALHSARQGKTPEQMGEEAREFGNKFAATFSRPPVATPNDVVPTSEPEAPPMSTTTSLPPTPSSPAAPPYGMGPGRTGVVAAPARVVHRPRRRGGFLGLLLTVGLAVAGYGLGQWYAAGTGFEGSPEVLAAGFAVAGAGLALLVVGLTGRRAGFTAFLVALAALATVGCHLDARHAQRWLRRADSGRPRRRRPAASASPPATPSSPRRSDAGHPVPSRWAPDSSRSPSRRRPRSPSSRPSRPARWSSTGPGRTTRSPRRGRHRERAADHRRQRPHRPHRQHRHGRRRDRHHRGVLMSDQKPESPQDADRTETVPTPSTPTSATQHLPAHEPGTTAWTTWVPASEQHHAPAHSWSPPQGGTPWTPPPLPESTQAEPAAQTAAVPAAPAAPPPRPQPTRRPIRGRPVRESRRSPTCPGPAGRTGASSSSA